MGNEHMEAELAVLNERLGEGDRQIKAAWSRIDEHTAALAEYRLELVKASARLEERLSALDKSAEKQIFSLWRALDGVTLKLSIIATVAAVVLNFVISKIDLKTIFK